MLARIRKAQEEHEGGFTLIELLVVIIIIGILAAIAIPVFLNQRKKAVDASMKSDLRTVANAEETYFVDNQAYAVLARQRPNVHGRHDSAQTVKLSPNNTLAVDAGDDRATPAPTASRPRTRTQLRHDERLVYMSNHGGLQPARRRPAAGF